MSTFVFDGTGYWEDDSGKYVLKSDLLAANAQVHRLQSMIEDCLVYIEAVANEPIPEKAHEGSCHPDAGCDGLCMAHANVIHSRHAAKLLLQRIRENDP